MHTARMTDAEFCTWLADVRAQIAERLAALDQVDRALLTDEERDELDYVSQMLLELQAQTADDAIALELLATELADRELTPAELQGLRIRQ